MRYLDLRELLELAVTGASGLAVAFVVRENYPQVIPRWITRDLWLVIGGGIGFLVAMTWSAWKVGRTVDRRLPRHLRPVPRLRDGRPFGVLTWRARDLVSEYLWLVAGVLVVLVIIWLAKTFVPGW
ncbi:MAG: hypothetical protein ABI836_15800 [Gemmatimonadota bacterium]